MTETTLESPPVTLKESKNPEIQERVESKRAMLEEKKPRSPIEYLHQEARDKVAADIVRERLRSEVKKAKDTATRDPLTDLYNRRFFDEQVDRAISQVQRDPSNNRAYITISDIDDYGMFNGKYGMSTGDEVLRETADVYRNSVRAGTDTAARLGGEELAVLSIYDISESGTQDLDEYLHPIKRIQEGMAEMDIHDASGNQVDEIITSSFGVTRYIPGEEKETFQKRAELAIRFAKMLGKNRIVHAVPNPDGTVMLDDLATGDEYVYWSETSDGEDGKKKMTEFIVNNTTGEQSIVVPIEKGKSKLVKLGDNNG